MSSRSECKFTIMMYGKMQKKLPTKENFFHHAKHHIPQFDKTMNECSFYLSLLKYQLIVNHICVN